MYRIFFLAIVFGLLSAPISYAQFSDSGIGSDISITSIPENPGPLEPVFLELKSYSADLNQANIVWRYNGTIVSSGIGKTKFNTLAPKANTSVLLTATISGSGITSTTASINLRTASIDLLWEAVGAYTPPFYKGKALFLTNGTIRVTAIPTRSAPKNISFLWTRNDDVDEDSSGYNRDSIVFENDILKKDEHISVDTQGGFFGGSNTITISPSKPQLVMYQKKDGYIDYNNGFLSSFSTGEPGVVLRFEPYFFSTPNSIANDLIFDMKNNNNSLYGYNKPNELSLSRPDNGGLSAISVGVNTAVYSLQNILKQFNILFK